MRSQNIKLLGGGRPNRKLVDEIINEPRSWLVKIALNIIAQRRKEEREGVRHVNDDRVNTINTET